MRGGEALLALAEQLPEDLPAAGCIVLDGASSQRSVLPELRAPCPPSTRRTGRGS